jgi:polyphosphate glucokinase
MNVLVIDVGGTNVKIAASNQGEARKFASGPTMTVHRMVSGVKNLARGWKYDRVSIGYPGVVKHNHPVVEPHNLARGWVNFDYAAAFGCPVKIINDAAMQAIGSYKSGTMLFLGLGTGLGSSLVVDGLVVPMELAHLPYRRSTYEHYIGVHGRERVGDKKWRKHVETVVADLIAAFRPDDVVLGGGNSKRLKELPKACRLGNNHNAFVGGCRLWERAQLPEIGRPAKKRAR